MVYLILTTIFSTLIGFFLRLSQRYITKKGTLLWLNYITASFLSLCFTGFSNLAPQTGDFRPTLLLGLVNSFCYIFAFVMNQENIRKNGMVLSSVFSRTGALMVPLLFSLLLFSEIPTALQIAGAALALLSIFCINYDGGKSTASAKILLPLLFIAEGMSAAMPKIYREAAGNAFPDHFLLLTFGFGALFSFLMSAAKKEWPGRWELFFGVIIGIVNFFSLHMLVKTLEVLPAFITYPTRGVGSLSLLTLSGVVLFGERLRWNQWVAFITVLISVVLLNL